MKLKLKHIIPYLPYKLNIDVMGISCEVEGIDLHQKNTVISERVNYKFSEFKLILIPLDNIVPKEDILSVLGEYWPNRLDEFKFRVSVGTMNYETMLKLFNMHVDVFGLINNGLAIKKHTNGKSI